MPQKLPTIQYNRTGVQTLGRYDIYGPYKASSAKLGAINAGLGLARTLQDVSESADVDKAAVISSEMTEEMAELNARIKNTKMWSVDDLDEMGVDYNPTDTLLNDAGVEEEKIRESVPAYEIAEDIYKSQAEVIKAIALSKVSGKGIEAVERNFASLYKQGIDDAVLHQINHIQDAEKIRMRGGFDRAASQGNYKGAMIIADTAYEQGVWTANEFYGYTKELPNRIKTAQYMMELDSMDDNAVLEERQFQLLTDDDLKPESKRQLYTLYESKITKQLTIIEKARKEMEVKTSATSVVRLTDSMSRNKRALSSQELLSVVGLLTPADKKIVGKLNNSLHNVTNQDALRRLTRQVHTISLPTPGVEMNVKRQLAVDNLIEALDNKELAVGDFSNLYGQVNRATGFIYSDPNVEKVADTIYRQITGGSKDIISQALAEGGVHALVASEAEWDMNAELRRVGPGFNPWAWWKSNRSKYMVESLQENIDEMNRQISRGDIITKDGSRHQVDMDKTIEHLNQRQKAGELSTEQVNEIIKNAESNSSRIKAVFGMDPNLKEQFSQ